MINSHNLSDYNYLNGKFYYRLDSQNVIDVSEKKEHLEKIRIELIERIKIEKKRIKDQEKIIKNLSNKKTDIITKDNFTVQTQQYEDELEIILIDSEQENGDLISNDLFDYVYDDATSGDDFSDDYDNVILDESFEKEDEVFTPPAQILNQPSTTKSKIHDNKIISNVDCSVYFQNSSKFLKLSHDRFLDNIVFSNSVSVLGLILKNKRFEMLKSNINTPLFLFYTGNDWKDCVEFYSALDSCQIISQNEQFISMQIETTKIDIMNISKILNLTFAGNLINVAKEIRSSGMMIKTTDEISFCLEDETVRLKSVPISNLFLFKLLYAKAHQDKDRKVFEKLQNEINFILFISSQEDIISYQKTFQEFSEGSSHWLGYIEGSIRAIVSQKDRDKYKI